MFLHVKWIVCLVYIIIGIHAADKVDKCVTTGQLGTDDRETFCAVVKADINLLCARDEIIVPKSLQLTLKNKTDCTKRVLSSEDEFCCKVNTADVSYDGYCLQSHWNTEDTEHYKMFIKKALETCMDKSKCTLTSDMFEHLQRKIPDNIGHTKTEEYASYFQVLYRCIKEPENPVQFCSTTSVQRTSIHFRESGRHGSNNNRTCTCSVTSHNKDVSVKAVDVRTTHNGLHLNTKHTVRNVSGDDLPLFGFREILSAKGINISLKLGSQNAAENLKLWLHVSAADGQDVNVTCSEGTGDVREPTVAPGHVSSVTEEAVFGSWPILYLALGSISTFLAVICVLACIWCCRYRWKKKRRRHDGSLPYPHGYLPDGYDPPYATVLDQTPKGRNIRVSRSVSSQTLQRPYAKPYPRPYPRSTSMRSLRDRPPMAPPPPPPNPPARKLENNSQPYSHLSRTPGVSCDVSQLEAFLECKEPMPSEDVSNAGSVQTSMDGPRYESPSRCGPRSRLESDHSMMSNQMSMQGFESMPRSGASSPQCFGSVFESEASVTESLLGKGDSPPRERPRDLLGDHEDVTHSLLFDHKEDENHNEFDMVEPVLTRM